MINRTRPMGGNPTGATLARKRPWTVTPSGPQGRALPPTRRYEISWLTEVGEPMEMVRVAPAIASFEAAFAAFARGALVQAPVGWIAIEDLQPGMLVMTREGARPVRWIGRIVLPPPSQRQEEGSKLYRISADALGPQRPGPDLVLCSAARLAQSPRRLTGRGPDEALLPIADLADGNHIIQITPATPIAAFHLALDAHAIINVNGVEVESYHPGEVLPSELTGDLGRIFHTLFPHLDASRSFGPLALPHATLEQSEDLLVDPS